MTECSSEETSRLWPWIWVGQRANLGLRACHSISSISILSGLLFLIQPAGPTLHSQIVSNLEQAWELLGGSEDQLLSTMMQISQVVAQKFTREKQP